MPSSPAFVTTYEILRSQDYVMITFSTPTGEVKDGQMLTQEIQKIAFTYPRFLEFAATVAQIAEGVRPAPAARRPAPLEPPGEQRGIDSQREESARGSSSGDPAGRIVRH